MLIYKVLLVDDEEEVMDMIEHWKYQKNCSRML